MQGNVQVLLDRLRVHRASPNGWYSAYCPAHEDTVPSLSIRQMESGYVFLKCHAGCHPASILEAVGLTWRDIRGDDYERQPARVDKTYVYQDVDGTPLYRVVRMIPKSFRMERYVGGKWVNGGVDQDSRVIYRLPSIAALGPSETIWFVEGEKDCDLLAMTGFASTCIAGGCKAKWTQKFTDQIAGEFCRDKVVIVPDADDVGRDFAWRVAGRLSVAVEKIGILELFPERNNGSDVSDYARDVGSIAKFAEEMRRLADKLWAGCGAVFTVRV